ncbi:PREDICTED: sister chromatid cohesion 1 protein 2 isoform X2 [Nicotiana attenuata]|uniref:sister chromatid cohesion 1 protein 2 isoform X2 n=1 Tax=Nicotiana attenuata TaxID=49451 RepID=UPI000905110A|nr:PREDICTED: sister chromatid cohesion 1 protein 2 isoform X2 [Nicotiana attenuata]
MFYSQFLLSKKGALRTIWFAAHFHKRLKKDQVQQTNIPSSVDKILKDGAPVVTYRILGPLLLGVRSTSKLSALRIEGLRAPNCSIKLPKKFELDTFELEVLEDQNASSGHVASREEIMLSDAWRSEQTRFGLSSKYEEDVSRSESLTTDHTPVRDVCSPHLMDKDVHFRPSLGSGHLAALWHLNGTRFSLEERFEPMTFGDLDFQMTSDKTADHQTDEQMKESNAGNLVNEEHLSSLEEHAEPMITVNAEAGTNISQQSEKIRQPIGLLKHPDTGGDVDDEGPAGVGESFSVEKQQKKNAEASSSRNGKDRTEHDRSLCIDVHPDIKLSGSTSPDFISVRTPATKERTRISRKRRCIFDESIVISNEVYKGWIGDTNDLVCKRRKAPHTSYLARKVHKISSLPQSFEEPLIPCGDPINIISAICKIRSTRDGPAETVDVPSHEEIPGSPNTLRYGEQMPVASATSLREDIRIGPLSSLREDIPESPGELRCEEQIPIAPAAPLHVGIPESPKTLRYDGEQTPIAPATPVTGSSSLRFHDMQGISRSHNEPASSTESTKGAPQMEDQELEMDLMDEEINSSEGDTSEKYNFSLRTRKVARFLLGNFLARKGKEKVEVVNLSSLLKGKTKKQSSRVFYEILVLKSGGWIDVRQDDAYSSILVRELPRLKQTFEAEGIHSKS